MKNTLKNTNIIEAGLSLVSIWWAVFLWTNDEVFEKLPRLFTTFEKVAPEKYWSFVFLAAALIKIIGILNHSFFFRRIGLTMSFVLYGVITAGFILSKEPLSHGTGTHFVLCIFALYALREVKKDAG